MAVSGVLQMEPRRLQMHEILFGGVWVGPSRDNGGVDLGQENADATVAAAVAAGITEFDTAPWYGSGAAEERLGKAVSKLPAGSCKVTTKTGRMIKEQDGSPCISSIESSPWDKRILSNDYTANGAKASLEQSLARMGISECYGLRIHDPNDNSTSDKSVDEVDVALREDGMLAGLREMRSCGRVTELSLGMNTNGEAFGVPGNVVRLIRGAPEGTFDCAMLAGGWNLLNQRGLPCLLECERSKIRVHIAGIFASGLLVGVDRYAYSKAPPEMVAKTQRWRELAEKHGASLPAVAVAFAGLPRVVSRVVIGMSTVEQVEQTVETVKASNAVPNEIWAEAKELGLLDAAVPLPA